MKVIEILNLYELGIKGYNCMNGSVLDIEGVATAIRANSGGHNEPKILTLSRTEYGKQIRKDYESGKIKEQRKNISKLEPRDDGLSNTLTTVQKDNMVLEPSGIYTNVSPDFQGGELAGLSRTLKANKHDAGVVINARIRKLTPLECWRLMDFDDEDFYKAKAAGVSDSQLYAQAGNSIVVNVLTACFAELIPNNKEIIPIMEDVSVEQKTIL